MRQKREGKNTSCRVFVHNIPNYLEAYTVVRISDRQLYYYGTYKSKEEAREAVREAYDWGDPEYQEEIIRVLEEPRWIPCSERLPEENTTVIGITTFDDIYKAELYDDCGEKKWCADGDYDVPIVAWMPLPQLYKAESEDKE